MMRRFYGLLLLLLFCAPVGVRAQCVMASALSQLHALQSDLASHPEHPQAALVVLFIDGQMVHLQDDALADIAAIHPTAGAFQAFADFADKTDQLLQAFARGGAAALPAHFQRDEVRASLRLTGQYLFSLGCIPRTTGVTPGRGTVGQISPAEAQVDTTDQPAEEGVATPLDNVRRYLSTPTGALSGALAVLGAAVLAFLIKTGIKRRRRRARRFDCHYRTRYKFDGQAHDGVILDVSGMGIKLRHDADDPIPTGQMLAVWIFDEWHEGTVTWGNAHYAGILFRRALRQRVVRELHKGKSIRATQPA